VAAPGRTGDLAAWAAATWPDADVYTSADDRVVAIGGGAGEPPPDLLARAPHAWEFTPYERS
jgi:hypothetical protein